MTALGDRRAEQVNAGLEPGDDTVQVVARGARVLELFGDRRGVGQQRRHDAAVPERAPAGNMRAEYSSSDSSTSDEPPKSEPPAVRPPTAAAAVVAKTAARPRGARDIDAKVLHTILNASGPIAKRDILTRVDLDLSVGQLEGSLRRLADAGKVTAEGQTTKRRYRAGGHRPHSEAGARTAAGRERSAAKLTDAVGRVGLRDRVMKAICGDPAALDNARLAQALDADLEDVADACSQLVGKGRVQMAEDGTYLRSVAEAAREVAAA